MRIPRDVSGQQLVRMMLRFGYQTTRQKGSHIRVTTLQGGEHHVTIPDHSALRLGTLSSILTDVARHLGLSREALVEQLFGK